MNGGGYVQHSKEDALEDAVRCLTLRRFQDSLGRACPDCWDELAN